MNVHAQVVADLTAETADLLGLLDPLPAAGWATPTPAAGWSVQDQVNHLAWFDQATVQAVTDPSAFRASLDGMTGDFPDRLVAAQRDLPPAESLAWFRSARAQFLEVAAARAGATRLPWYGAEMSLTSSVTARLMETWAHGQDVADALGVTRTPTARLRHVCHLGVVTRGFSYRLRGREAPDVPVFVGLTAPDGTTWQWGPVDAAERVSGPALDFALVVTQRRPLRDTTLLATGPAAAEWLTIAQAYAGLPGPGRG
jgi:uncharacterized protein (TIGR03084 family)